MPKVSVIMPAYNAGKYIREAINSILSQTFSDFEFIILNDCSTDSTEEIILSYHDPRIVYVKNEKNLGVAATLNRGLEMARGEYIARMDADDISLPERFAKQVAYMDEHQGVAVCGCAINLFTDNKIGDIRKFPSNPVRAQLQLLFSPCIAHPSAVLRRQALDEHNLHYNLSFEGTEDYALWWEIGKYGTLVALSDCLLFYRVHPQQVSQNGNTRVKSAFIPFAAKRLLDLNVSGDDMAATVLYEYTSGMLSGADASRVEKFIEVIGAIKDSKVAMDRFGIKPLRRYLEKSVYECIENSDADRGEKKSLYRLSKNAGFHTGKYRLKYLYAQVLRRIK